jgi:hypothetical protein
MRTLMSVFFGVMGLFRLFRMIKLIITCIAIGAGLSMLAGGCSAGILDRLLHLAVRQ